MRRTDLIDQPTAAPTRKVKATGAWGGLMVLGLVVLRGAGVEVPGLDGDVLDAAVPGVLTGLGAALAGYLTRERA